MSGIEVPCPLCEQRFDTDEAYAAHLADAHGLVDDDGTETTLEQAFVAAGETPPEEHEDEPADGVLALATVRPAIDPSRVYDPTADDQRYKPAIIGLAGLLVVAFALGGARMAFTGSDGDGSGREQEMAATPTTTFVDFALATPTTEAKGPSALSAETVEVVTTTTAPPPAAPAPSPAPSGDGGGDGGAPPVPAPADPPPPAPVFGAPDVSGASLKPCTAADPPRRNVTWHYEYTLSGGSNWAPPSTATPLGGGRYAESVVGRESDGFPAVTVRVINTLTGGTQSLTLSPSLTGQACPK